ncbi:MAG: polysaccharide deacetylase family protein [Saprospiraceae bacterium]|nr:polysaccharide deacetylase family protein [Saprospiraceae bacterium]
MIKVLLYSQTQHPRLEYVIRFIKAYSNAWDLQRTQSKEEYLAFEGPSINYSQFPLKGSEVFLFESGWLYKKLKDYEQIPKLNKSVDFILFPTTDSRSFDLFAALFYLIARIEEYLPFPKDKHGRFPATQSILFKNEALNIPIIDIWVFQFIQKLELKFQIKILKAQINPSWSIGIDIDQFYKFKYKSIFKKIVGTFRAFILGNFLEFKQRMLTYTGIQKDPFDSYHWIESLNIEKNQIHFFILAGGNSAYDKNQAIELEAIKSIVDHIKTFAQIGIHPSYFSNIKADSIAQEKSLLTKILGSEINKSRQHFLKIRFPETYQNLIKNQITFDFSLGYADQSGFRAGTCKSFNWYDVEIEYETSLIIYPLNAMDRTYLNYTKLTSDEAMNDIKQLFDSCMKYHGHFHLVWHNSSFDFKFEWKTWDGKLETLVKYFKCYNNNSRNES